MTYSSDDEEEVVNLENIEYKKPEDFTIPQLLEILEVVLSEKAQTLEEITVLRKRLEELESGDS